MNRTTRILAALAAATGIGLGSYGVASAMPGQTDEGSAESADSDTPLTGSTLDRAVAAALDHVGGGEVTDTEIGDDGAAYGVEIRLDDGSQIEVNLDENFAVVGSEPDDD